MSAIEQVYKPFRQAFGQCERMHLGTYLDGALTVEPWPAYCPECACMLDMEQCWFCGLYFLKFGASAIDDIIRDAAVDASGDVMCARCLEEQEDEEEEWEKLEDEIEA